MKQIALTEEMFFDQVKSYIHNEDSLAFIRKAYDYAQDKHKDQVRLSGEPYFVHLLSVAYELAKLKGDPKTVAAGLLHDTLEDCGVSREEFVQEFDEETYEIVEAVTKIGNLKFKDEKEYLAANHRKIFIAMAKDVRVILVKLVDRLHNMRTLQYQPPEKQRRIAKETLDVYAPIAHRLGIAEIKNELEDLSFLYLDADKYHEIARLVENKKAERDEAVSNMIEEISQVLRKHGIHFRILGRSKHLYSIHKKMVTKNKRFDEILDLLAIRIVTLTELNCYEVLGYIHATYRPIPGRLKDYIAMPKTNMYQSLHTTIVGNDGRIYEVQIRTEEMDRIAEHGIAAHWSYKEGAKRNPKDVVKELEWLSAFESGQEDRSAGDYMNDITNDIFNANVYAMTPKGRVIDLPHGATPIDFAYRIHTEVGHQTVGALVNGVLVPLNTPLKTGDVVELKTNKNSTPSEDWLKIVKTSNAKNKIRAFFAKKEADRKEEYVKQGEDMLKEEMKKRGVSVEEFFDKSKFEKIYGSLQLSTYADMMYAIAVKSITPISVIERLTRLSKKEVDSDFLNQIGEKNQKRRQNVDSSTGVVVKGISGMKIKLAPCCSPVRGDPIVGYVSKGQGIKVHRADCPNALRAPERLIEVSWSDDVPAETKFDTTIRIQAMDRSYLLTDLATAIAQYKANIMAVNIAVNNDDLTATASISITVTSKEHLETIMANLRKINSVLSVERAVK